MSANVNALESYLFNVEISNSAKTYKNDVSIKAVRKFDKAFKTVTGEKWYRTSNGFFATFRNNGVTTEVYYNKKGTWLYNFLTYHQEHLPVQVCEMIRHHIGRMMFL